MKKGIFTVALIATLSTLFAFTLPVNWEIAPKYNLSFSTNGVSGIFKTFTGSIVFDEQNGAASRFDVSIDVNSINTGNGMQNKHAKSADWFDAAKYPQIRFVSKKIVKTNATYQVTGDLSLHGITREVTFPFTFLKNGGGATFGGLFTINRNDFKIGTPGGEVGEVIKLAVSVPVVKK
ncbi:MAG TPA: YceI family protein [Flavisolibacter sp.]|jgi:polyisoprenoid-binding protein YceI|nr:YceI family protein [Flavisolibacter sp.]